MKRSTVMAVGVAGLWAAVAGAQDTGLKVDNVKWAETVKVKGDLRYRVEQVDEEGKDVRDRERIRARLGVDGKANDEVSVGLQMATGASDPVSRNSTLSGGFGGDDMDFGLDLAYIKYAPVDGVEGSAGKIKNPFINVGDLIWDTDLTPEGVAVNTKIGSDKGVEAFGNAGYIWVEERAGESDDTKLYAGQAALKVRFTPETYVLAGGSYYAYDNMENYAVIDWQDLNKSYGNSTRKVVDGSVTNLVYANEYTTVEGFAEAGIWMGVPLRVFGQYAVNTDADAFDTAYLAGAAIGKAKNPKTYEVSYNYYEVEKDAVVGAFADSDRHGGGTDGKGHKFAAKYQMAKNFQLGASYFMNDKTISDDAKEHNYDRVQLDLVASF